jgi:arginyl-tRNA synthetase
MQSIIDTIGDIDEKKIDYSLLTQASEFSLIKKITTLEETIQRAKEDLAPHYIARYCFELAQLVNSYYAHTKIVIDDEATKIARVFLLKRVRGILESAMELI